MRKSTLRIAVTATLVAFAAGVTPIGGALTVGCGTQCDRNPNEPPVRYTDGDTSDGVYESAPLSGPYLDFPPGRTYRFVHELGAAPRDVQAWFSFNTFPVATSADGPPGSGAVLAAGNQATVTRNTPTSFDVRNDTCSDVKLRVLAQDPKLTSPGDGGGASTEAGPP